MAFPGSLAGFVLHRGTFVDLYLPECTNIFIVSCTSHVCEAFSHHSTSALGHLRLPTLPPPQLFYAT